MGQQDEYPNGRNVGTPERLQELPLPGMVTEDDCALERFWGHGESRYIL